MLWIFFKNYELPLPYCYPSNTYWSWDKIISAENNNSNVRTKKVVYLKLNLVIKWQKPTIVKSRKKFYEYQLQLFRAKRNIFFFQPYVILNV